MIGQTLAHYEITALLGKGGMGEVYRARDTKLGREIALKLLPQDIGGDAERLARFRREATVLASLNHPNIASIHGLEEDQGHLFLALELAEGEDLTHRLAGGPLPVEDVLAVARQLADGLEHAHERGVVHRDLKPANVRLSEDGTVKILDFGLARAYAGESAEEGNPATSPTITAAMTQAGTILGTAAYMSPEQARGLEVDRRADIWAFGVILYEMLTGKRLFDGETISDTLAEVLKTDPDFDALPGSTPEVLRWLVQRCLQKRPSRRLRDIGEARVLLESDVDALPTTSVSGTRAVVIERPRWMVPVVVAVAVLALTAGLGLARFVGPGADSPTPIHATLLPPEGAEIHLWGGSHPAVSPDGTRIVFGATDSTGADRLWVRRLDSPAPHVLSGTEGGFYPFWSPDGRKIGFFAEDKLKKIDAGGGVATAVCDAPAGRGGTWTEDDHILFAFEIREHLQIVPASGGTPKSVTEKDSLDTSHRWPVTLPDQEHFLYLRMGETDRLCWRSLDSGDDEIVILTEVSRAAFADGHLFFGRDEALWARPFDPASGTFLGEEILVAESIVSSGNYGSSAYGVANDGTLVYAIGNEIDQSVMAVFDGEGNELERFTFENGFAQDPNLSPDGRYLAVGVFPADGAAGPDIWIRDLERGTLSRFTTDEKVDDPVWSPTGDRIVYSSQDGDLFVRSTRGSRELLMKVEVGQDAITHDWSPDGTTLVISTAEDDRSIFLVPLDDPTTIQPLVHDSHYTIHAAFSPDGRWIAYTSGESGEAQVYLREVAEGGGTWQVSPSTGQQPRWHGDGSEIFYLAESGIRATPVRFTERGPEFGRERRVFDVGAQGFSRTHRYDVTDDADRFVVQLSVRNDTDALQSDLELVVGWRQVVVGP